MRTLSHMHAKESRQFGFSLIELLLYIALVAIVLGSVAAFYNLLLVGRVKHATITEVEQQGDFVLQEVLTAVRNAEAITSPSVGSSATTLVLDMYDTAEDPTTIDVNSGVLRVCSGSGCTATGLHSSTLTASSISFTNVSRSGTPGAVTVRFTLDSASASDRYEYTYPKNFYGTASLRQP